MIGPTDLLHPSPAPHFKTFHLFLFYCPKRQSSFTQPTFVLFVMLYFIHLVVSIKTGPKPPPKPALHIVRSRASSFKWEYPLLSLRTSVASYVFFHVFLSLLSPFSIFPSITRCRRQFLRKIWPIQLAFRFLISCRIFLCSLILSNTSSFLTWSVQLIFSILLQHHISKLSRFFSDLLPEASNFQHHIKLCSKWSILLVSSSIISPICQ